MNRRRFIATTSALSAAGVLRPVSSQDHSLQSADQTIHLDGDGLRLSPRQYASVLQAQVEDPEFRPDNYSLGGAVEKLEKKFATLLGKQSAVFIPTGTLANHLALRELAGKARRILVQADSHIYCDSGDCAQILSGLNLIPLSPGKPMFGLEEARSWLDRTASGRVQNRVGVISIETPVRRHRHAVVDFDELRAVAQLARENSIRLHLDGARLFNLPHHTGKSVSEYSALFDTVYVSLYKCFNAASGAILAGTNQFTDGLFHLRRMFGGSMAEAWPVLAVAQRYADSYLDEYEKAWAAAEELMGLLLKNGRFTVMRQRSGTSTFRLDVKGVEPTAYLESMKSRNVILPKGVTEDQSAVFYITINPTLNRVAPQELARAFTSGLMRQ